MLSGIPSPTGSRAQRTILNANSASASANWTPYTIPPNATFLYIFLLAGGGGGGVGRVIGTGTGGGGGGGGGSSSQSSVLINASLLPSTIYFSIGLGGASNTSGIQSRVAVIPGISITNETILVANGGSAGANSTTTTGGGAGGGGGASTTALSPFSLYGFPQFLAGQGGANGGNQAVAGSAITLPTTGLVVTGGAGGGGVPTATGTAGPAGGSFTTPASNLFFPPHTGGSGGATTTTTAPRPGAGGINFIRGLGYFYGGTGGQATHGGATGAGLVQAAGGPGGFGCGGGGSGGAITGSTAGPGGRGGDGIAIIYAW